MRILISSIVDLKNSAPNRLHHFINDLCESNEVVVLSIRDFWKINNTNNQCNNFQLLFDKISIEYFTDKNMSPVKQEVYSIKNIYTILKDMDYETFDLHINYNTLISGYYITRILKKAGIPTIYDIADDLPEMVKTSPQIPPILRPLGGYVANIMIRKNIRASERISAIGKEIQQKLDIPHKNFALIPNAVDTNVFKKYDSVEIEHIMDKYDLHQNFIIGYVGVLREWVDIETIFNALKDLQVSIPNIKVLIVGEEGGLRKFQNLADEFGISEKVIFTGTVAYEDVSKYIACMDVCMIPFKLNSVAQNSLPLKLFEYMACEKPVVSTKLREVENTVGNLVLYANTPNQYFEQIVKLHQDEELRHKLGLHGYQFVRDNYTWSRINKKFIKVLEDVVLQGI